MLNIASFNPHNNLVCIYSVSVDEDIFLNDCG